MTTTYAVELIGDLGPDARNALDAANVEVSGVSHGKLGSEMNHRYVRVDGESADDAKAAVAAVIAAFEGVFIGPHDVKPADS